MIPEPTNQRLNGGIFFLCMATLMYELILTRIFSVLMWYHFASMAISLALFGLGAAALLVYLRPGWFAAARTAAHCSRYATLFALSVALFFLLFVWFRLQPTIGFKVLSFFSSAVLSTVSAGQCSASDRAGFSARPGRALSVDGVAVLL